MHIQFTNSHVSRKKNLPTVQYFELGLLYPGGNDCSLQTSILQLRLAAASGDAAAKVFVAVVANIGVAPAGTKELTSAVDAEAGEIVAVGKLRASGAVVVAGTAVAAVVVVVAGTAVVGVVGVAAGVAVVGLDAAVASTLDVDVAAEGKIVAAAEDIRVEIVQNSLLVHSVD